MSRVSPQSALMHCHTILVVEDDVYIRDCLAELFADEGYHVLTARHGGEALELLRGDATPSVILLDLMMPVVNGWQVLEALRNDARLASIPVLVVSAAIYKDCRPNGAARHLRKPINLEVLLREVREQCSPQPTARAANLP